MVSTSWFSGKKFEHGRFPGGALKLAPLKTLMMTKRNEATAEHVASWMVAALNEERFAYENRGQARALWIT
jgi:hypothetical protein